jgi:hypothetical protein
MVSQSELEPMTTPTWHWVMMKAVCEQKRILRRDTYD